MNFSRTDLWGGRRVTGASTRNQTPDTSAVPAGAGGGAGELIVMPGNTKIPEKSGGKIKMLQQYPGKHLQAVSKPERSKTKPEFSVVSSADTIWR